MSEKRKSKRKSAFTRVESTPPGEQEISDTRDDAASAVHYHETHNPDKVRYAEGVRDTLAWVIGDGEKPEF